ncbi:MAG: hypothetical protein HY454_03675 [Parcubacteria group bacterium]|nr:hypothetical protein [Parcubacteria group bacterium]
MESVTETQESYQPTQTETRWAGTKSVPTRRVFWTSIVALVGITLVAWAFLHNTDDTRRISIPIAEEVVSVKSISLVADFQAGGNGQAFFDAEYKTLLIGKSGQHRILMVGITKSGVSYSYEETLVGVSSFQEIKEINDFHPIWATSAEAVMGRDWWWTIFINAVAVIFFGFLSLSVYKVFS